jgi:hypothetical protein
MIANGRSIAIVGWLSVTQEIAGRPIEEDGRLDFDDCLVPKYHICIETVSRVAADASGLFFLTHPRERSER